MHQEKVKNQFLLMKIQNTYVFQQFFVVKDEIKMNMIKLLKEKYLNMNYDLMINEYQQIFQIYFGKQNTNKYNKYINKLILHFEEIKQKTKRSQQKLCWIKKVEII